MKQFIYKNCHFAAGLYFLFYVSWYTFFGQQREIAWNMIEAPLDSLIPFNELFVIPYYLWFPFVPGVMLFFFFKSREAFCRCGLMLAIGMTTALFINTVYPTAINFRPVLEELGRDNLFIKMVDFIYFLDPGTYVLPSVHCSNSLTLAAAVCTEQCTAKYPWFRIGSVVLTVFICLSTMFIKQHSVIDVVWSLVVVSILYCLIYLPYRMKLSAGAKKPLTSH